MKKTRAREIERDLEECCLSRYPPPRFLDRSEREGDSGFPSSQIEGLRRIAQRFLFFGIDFLIEGGMRNFDLDLRRLRHATTPPEETSDFVIMFGFISFMFISSLKEEVWMVNTLNPVETMFA